MKWYDNTAARLEQNHVYTRQELLEMLQEDYPYTSRNSYQWAIGEMVKAGKLTKTGYSQYQVLSADNPRKVYIPQYSKAAQEIMNLIKAKWPEMKATLFETALLNEFLSTDNQITDNVIYIEVEKGHAAELFLFLQEQGIPRLVHKPTPKTFQFYKTKNSIVITDLAARSPMARNSSCEICLEKLLVDIYCDKLIRMAYSFDEFAAIAATAQDMYFVDKPTMIRYAERRNKKPELLHDCPGLAEDDFDRNELRVKILCDAADIIGQLPENRRDFFTIITSEKMSQYEYAKWQHVTPQAITNRIISLYDLIIRTLGKKYEYSEEQLKAILGYKDRMDLLKDIRALHGLMGG